RLSRRCHRSRRLHRSRRRADVDFAQERRGEDRPQERQGRRRPRGAPPPQISHGELNQSSAPRSDSGSTLWPPEVHEILLLAKPFFSRLAITLRTSSGPATSSCNPAWTNTRMRLNSGSLISKPSAPCESVSSLTPER